MDDEGPGCHTGQIFFDHNCGDFDLVRPAGEIDRSGYVETEAGRAR
jgi:hypothetical protein